MGSLEVLELEDKPAKTQGKIQRTLDSILKRMEISDEEIKYRMENFDNVDIVKQYMKYLKCTKCSQNFQNTINKGKTVGIHPLLGVLMCESCCDYYGDGDFSLDSEGEDKYCRWCGEGGTIFACSKCICGFCDFCIKKHFGESGLKAVENDDDWVCYFCNPKPLWNLRSICFLAAEASKNKKDQLKNDLEKRRLKKKKKRKENDFSSSESDSSSTCNTSSQLKRKRPSKHWGNKKPDKLSTEDEKENHVNSNKKSNRSKNKNSIGFQSSDSESNTPLKKLKYDNGATDFETKRTLVLEKLRSIWRLTQTVMEVGMSSCRERLRNLKHTGYFRTLERLKSEHEELKTCMEVLVSSLSTASNSVNSITDDLMINDAIDEKELFQSQEIKLKRLANKLQERSKLATNTDSDSDSSGKARKSKRQKNGQPTKATEKKEKKRKSGDSSDIESEDRGKSKTVTLLSGSDSENKNGVTGEDLNSVKPLLKVKSFAKMLDENVYDKNKTSEKETVVVELYEIDTDEGDSGKAGAKYNSKAKMSKSEKNGASESEKDEEEKKNNLIEATTVEDKKSEEENDKCDEDKKMENESGECEKEKSSEEKEASKQSENRKNSDNDKSEKDLSKADKESSGSEQERKKKKKEKNSADLTSSEDEPKMRKTRSKKKSNQELKASFEKYKEKRQKFLRSGNEKAESKTAKPLDSSDSEKEKKPEKCKRKRILESSDEENEENEEKAKEMEDKSEKEQVESNTSKPTSETSSDEEQEVKKRKRIRKKTKSSDSSEAESKRNSSDSSDDEDTKKRKKGRKNIKKILKKDSLKVETKEALKNEEERKKRIKERQKLFKELFSEDESGTPKQIVLDFDPETKEPLVTVHKKLAKKLKPHQVKGIRFMWDSCFESLQRLETETGSGCILAHCMGLGKTLQVVTLVHTVMTHDMGVNTVLIVCPLSTVSNWIREFEMWLENIHTDPITLFDLVKYKKVDERQYHLEDWHKNGGVMVLSYDMFRTLTKSLTKKERKRKSKSQKVFEEALLDPGPDLIVCDEGHLLKNEDTALSKCMSRVKTSRRIVLTGTPLQNNLIEYHCMVQFVKPNILGTKKEFCNRFVNPINNGQFEDSTELDVKIMKRRSHVLHSMLEGCVQRFDYSVLTPFLPEKHEYVLSISLTETQAKAYTHFIRNLSAKSSGSSRAASLFNDYHTLQKIWTHPRTLLMQSEKESQKEALRSDSEGSLKDFIVDTDEESDSLSSSSEVQEIAPKKRILRSNANDPEVIKAIEEEQKQHEKHWWDEFYGENALDDLRESNKLILLFALLKHCEEKKDKVLVFSQSLFSLDLIEYFLARIDENNKKDDETLCGHQGTWNLGSDYFRLDGSTNSETRAHWCKYFNRESNTRARLFLISTKAGGLGINLYGANRVVIFDASWNPSHDLQSIFRVYRFGQKKTCYIYRFLSEATMEEKIYERQVTKLSLAHRVVDEHQIERHYSMGNLQELYMFEPTPKDQRKVPKLPKDSVLADLLTDHKDIIVKYHEHDSLLENKQEEELSEEERKAAWKEYEEEKAQKSATFDPAIFQQMMLMQQGQGVGVIRTMNPTYLNQANLGQQFFNPLNAGQHAFNPKSSMQFINPMNSSHQFINPIIFQQIPLDMIQKGMSVGVTPLPGENLQSYMARINSRERWHMEGQVQGK